MSGGHVLKSWSTTQATVAMSSAEAELYALVKGAAQTLGMLAIGRDLGISMRATVHSDASAALSIIQRQGTGKLRHVSTQFLWIQEKTRNDAFDVAKIPGEENPADVLTKNVSADIMMRHLDSMNVELRDDRAKTAPNLMVMLGDPQGGPGDSWHEGESQVTRHHERPRRELFTPMRVGGSPPNIALTSTRITRGEYLDDGARFTWTDSWRARATAHRDMGRLWTGTTTFILNSRHVENVQSRDGGPSR